VAQTGVKQTGHVESAERCQLITVWTINSATGNVLQPVFLFSLIL
jgi:hypothetical protein